MALSKHLIHALCSRRAKEHIISPPLASLEIKANRQRKRWELVCDLGTRWSHLAGKEEGGGDGDRAQRAKVQGWRLLVQKSQPTLDLGAAWMRAPERCGMGRAAPKTHSTGCCYPYAAIGLPGGFQLVEGTFPAGLFSPKLFPNQPLPLTPLWQPALFWPMQKKQKKTKQNPDT